MKKYIVIVKNKEDKDQLNSELSGLSSMEFVPDRPCQAEDVSETRCIHAFLTEEEANSLRNDPRIKSVSIKKPLMAVPLGFIPRSNETRIFNKNIGKSAAVQFRKPLPGDLMEAENQTHQESTAQQVSSQALDVYASIQNLPSGANVDVVIVDGIISGKVAPNLTIIFDGEHHPEFLDEQGNSRINLINWNQYMGENGQYPYENIMKDPGQLSNNTHGIHVAGIACGLNIGWARKSSIYNISPYSSADTESSLENYKYLLAIKNWHLSKGNSKPTVTNHSYGLKMPGLDIRYINSVKINGTTINAPRETRPASVTCQIVNGVVSSFNIIDSGEGYTNIPTVSFNGGGGDEAALIMAEGSIKEITVTEVGSGYNQALPPSITFSPPVSGEAAQATCEVNQQGKISRIVMTNRGSGYASPPTVAISPPAAGGTQATATVTVGSNFISRIQILNSAPWEPTGFFGEYDSNTPYQAIFWRGILDFFHKDPPMLVISGGGCVKDAVWEFTRDQELLRAWYGLPDAENYRDPEVWSPTAGRISDGLYRIAEKFIQLSSNSFKQVLLGGEYGSTPSVSFSYVQGGAFQVGQHAEVQIQDGQVSSMVPIFINDPASGRSGVRMTPGKVPSAQEAGWFTSPPQVFLTNGGGFSNETLGAWGVDTYENKGAPGDFPDWTLDRRITAIPARDPGMDSVLEDMMESGVIVVAAAGNDSWNVKENTNLYLDISYNYLNKTNPSIPYDDSIDFPWDLLGIYDLSYFPPGYWYVTSFIGLDWTDNPYEDIPFFAGSSPGATDGAICVGSISHECCPERKADYSNTGSRIDLYAAGDQITSCAFNFSLAGLPTSVPHPSNPNFRLMRLSGTSMASPQVCGAAACALTTGYTGPSNNQQSVMAWLKANAQSSLADLPFPNNLSGGTNKQLYFPGVTVIQQ